MNERPDDEALLAQFRDWLQSARAEAESEADPLGPDAPLPGAFGLDRLVEEFTALRHEVKLQTKSARGLQEQAEALLPALSQAAEQFRSVEPREKQAAFEAARPLAEALADLDEALDRGRLEAEKARRRITDDPTGGLAAELDALFERQSWFHRAWVRGYHERARALLAERTRTFHLALFEALVEGYDLIQARLKRALESEQVRRIDTRGQAVDPQRMTVVEVVEAPGHAAGTVLDEVRRGYTWRGRVLRFAEVRAVRASRSDAPSESEGASESAAFDFDGDG
jgi:molecular chaperone GrpE